MDKITETFINSFHTLSGTTIGERRKNLFVLINNTDNSINTHFLHAKSPLEENFKVEVLCRFNKYSELLDILKQGSRIHIKKILKHDGFVDETFVKNNATDLILILSQMSFSTKLKVLNRLGKRLQNNEQANEYFEEILNNYGLNFAVKLLPYCSSDLVLKYISKCRIELSSKQLLILIKKHIASTSDIFKTIHFNTTEKSLSQKYDKVFKFLINDWPLLVEQVKQYGADFNLGSRTTYKVFKTHGKVFFDSNRQLYAILKKRTIARMTKYPLSKDADERVSFCKVEESIPQLKELLGSSSNIKMRARLIASLVKTCKLNDDPDALLDVLNYIWDNHRRDHKFVIEEFLNTLTYYIDLSKLEERHWLILNEFRKILKDFGEFHFYLESLRMEYLYFRLNRNDPVEELLGEIIKSKKMSSFNSKYEKICLNLSLGVIYRNYSGQELTLKLIDYLHCQMNWNKSYSQDQLPLVISPEILDYFEFNLDENYWHADIVSEYIVHYFENAQKLLRPLLHSKFFQQPQRISSWLLKNHPVVFLENLEPLIQCFVRNNKISPYVLQVSSYYTHLGIPQKVSDICGQLISSKKDLSWILLACVTQQTEFSKQIPKEVTDMTVFQRNALKQSDDLTHCFKEEHLSKIKILINIARDEVNENKILEIFELLNQRDVSIRKYALPFAFNAVNLKDVERIITKIENENDTEINNVALKGVFNMFVKNPKKSTWNLFKKWVGNQKVISKSSIRVMTKCKKVSHEFFVEYFVLIWDVTKDYPEKSTFLEGRKCHLLSSISKNVLQLLPNEFCEKIIENNFLRTFELSKFNKLLLSFASQYVIYKNHTFLTNLFEKLKNCNGNIQKFKQTRSIIFYFVKQFCSHFLNENVQSSSVLNLFLNFWIRTFDRAQFYEELLYVHFTLIANECTNPEETSDCIAKLIESFNDDKCFVRSEFRKSYLLLRKHLLMNKFDEDTTEETELRIIENLVNKRSLVCIEFAICVLPDKNTLQQKCQVKRKSIIDFIHQESKNSKLRTYAQFYCI